MSVPLIFATAIVALVLIKIFQYLYDVYKFSVAISKIPNSKILPFIDLITMLRIKREDRYKWFKNFSNQFPDGIFCTWIGWEPSIHLTAPETVSVLLSHKNLITKSSIYHFIHLWLGNGLVTSTGQKWHRQRKLITPTFHFNILEQFAIVMSQKAEILKDCIQLELEKNPKEPLDMFVYMTRCTLDIICESAMGINIEAQMNHQSEYSVALHSITIQAIERIFRPWLHNDWIYYRTPHGKKFLQSVEIVHKLTNKVLSERKLARKIEQEEANNDEDYEKPKRRAFLDHLLDASERENTPLTDVELREQVDTFMFAGHDTTAAAMSWALFCIGNHPDVQKKIHEEQLHVFGDSIEPATLHQLSELKYLERVIKETLRLFPSAPTVSRSATEDVEIAGYKIPKGCLLSIQIYCIHLDPKHWPNPEKFDPDRFLPENSVGRHPYAYIPFSAGLRNCVGQKFSMMEQKIILTAVLRKYNVKSLLKFEDAACFSDFILRPQNGIYIYFTPK